MEDEMLIATSFAFAALVASCALAAGSELPATTPRPPLIVTVLVAPDVPPTLVTRLLRETEDVWREAGVTFVWRRGGRGAAPNADASEPPASVPSALRVVIGRQRGVPRKTLMPLGWIMFDDEHEPQPEIYLSHANAQTLMEGAKDVVGVVDQMPLVQREILLSRAMGRAFAHELGHYLLASKLHTARGLLQGRRTSAELFGPVRWGFEIDAAQRRAIAVRLWGEALLASR
jgi:hypothetical protein